MDLGITGKVAVVLSGSKGLGFACAKAFAAEGARVAICSRNADNLAAARTEITGVTEEHVFTGIADVSNPEELSAFLDEVERELGAPAILVVNSGGPPPKAMATTQWADWTDAIDVLLHSAHTAVTRVLPAMRAAKWGRILFITSAAVKQPIPGLGLSNAVRAAVTGFAKTLATEVAGDGVTVNCLCPGFIHTARIDQLAAMQARAQGVSVEEAIAHNMTAQAPIGRLGRPDEFGAVAAFLASDKASLITGSSIAVDGGLVKGLFG